MRALHSHCTWREWNATTSVGLGQVQGWLHKRDGVSRSFRDAWRWRRRQPHHLLAEQFQEPGLAEVCR